MTSEISTSENINDITVYDANDLKQLVKDFKETTQEPEDETLWDEGSSESGEPSYDQGEYPPEGGSGDSPEESGEEEK